MNCGTILYDQEFQFPNGATTNKLIIVLCDYGTDWLVLQTTRQQKQKTKNIGCQPNDKPHNYFILANTQWFEEDTWVRLDEVFEYNSDIFSFKEADKIAVHKNELPKSLMIEVLECALTSDDIEQFYLEFLERELIKIKGS